ncbi:MAG: transglutaminase domain protein [Acidimicrobiales bacterium]|nr:transglutaminase domain protein [Acidimicrobiales bacterium]
MRVRVGCEFVHTVENDTHAILQVEPRPDGDFSLVSAQWSAEPEVELAAYVDGYGNRCRRLTLSRGRSRLAYDAIVELDGELDPFDPTAGEVPAHELPNEAFVYALPSRYCPADQVADMAWKLFGSVEPGWTRVQTICDWIHDEIDYLAGSSDVSTSAVDVLASRTGVCRDLAHLAVAFCRAFTIPTKYVFGYLPEIDVAPTGEPIDFCAWIEVYLDGRWWTFDPRNNERRRGRVLIGRGRDALDVAMITTFGGAELETMSVWAEQVEG